jgi:transcriptional regulator with XRE-family HTH domain
MRLEALLGLASAPESRIGLCTSSAWAIGTSVVWVRVGGELPLAIDPRCAQSEPTSRSTILVEPFYIIVSDLKLIKGRSLTTIEQVRAARALLGWSQSELAARSDLSLPTVRRFEAASGARVSQQARDRLRLALEVAGIAFIDENGGGPGVRLRQRIRQAVTSPEDRAAKPELGYGYEKRNRDTILLPVQCRMARVALGLGVRELAAAARVSPDTVARFERGDELKDRTVETLRQVFELAGIKFTNGDQPGLRLVQAKVKRAAVRGKRRPETSGTKRRKNSPRKPT